MDIPPNSQFIFSLNSYINFYKKWWPVYKMVVIKDIVRSKWKWKSLSCIQLFVTPWTIYSPWNSPGFRTQGLNPNLPHCRWILYQLSHKGSPRILEWVAYPFSSGSSWPRNRTRVSCIAGRFFTNWAIREAPWLIMFRRWYSLKLTKIAKEIHTY